MSARRGGRAAPHWDGTDWTKLTSPDPEGQANFLQGVTAISADDVWAVG